MARENILEIQPPMLGARVYNAEMFDVKYLKKQSYPPIQRNFVYQPSAVNLYSGSTTQKLLQTISNKAKETNCHNKHSCLL